MKDFQLFIQNLLPNIKKWIQKSAKRFHEMFLLPFCTSCHHVTDPSSLRLLLVFIYIMLGILGLHFFIDKQTANISILPDLFPNFKTAQYPLVIDAITPDISAQAAALMDNDSKVILYAKNADVRFSLASTTKIMTAITALQYFKPNDILLVKQNFLEGSLVGLVKGETMTLENLLYGMLLPSGNDCAIAIADNFPGGESAFVARMNANARKWHLDNTHFADPAGLMDDDDYATPEDLARLGSIALQNPLFAKIVSTKSYRIVSADGLHVYTLNNLNELLGQFGVVGIKTGFTDQAKGVLVTASVRDGHMIIIVVMQSNDRFADTQTLLADISRNLTYLSMHR